MKAVNTPAKTPRARAAATRGRMVAAADRLFREHGYAATTMTAIAATAKVAVQTVYFTFHTKAELLSAVADAAIAGDASTAPDQAAWVQRIRAETDPRRRLRLFAEGTARVQARLQPVLRSFQAAMATDPAIGARYDARVLSRRTFVRSVVEGLAVQGLLREGLDIERATDIAFALSTPESFDTMTRLCGWPAEQWIAWVTDALIEALL